ncbi:MAG: threonylcarbamoyl-AMP synthase [Desulfobacteraceae bacterium 4572_123]|nr:MAG: threonylcarbamoyl-AMP synthase [Desulfobacteraceae bacterium 4572_123]
MAARILKIAPDRPARDTVNSGARIIANGGVVVFPTRGLYGLGADALNEKAVDRIFKIKERSRKKPVLVLICKTGHLELLVKNITPLAQRIMSQFWPGRVTLIFDALDTLPPMLTAGTGKIGIRMAGHPVAAALARAVDGPVTGTSANLAGEPGCMRIPDMDPAIIRAADLVLDAGPLQGGIGSTIVDVTGQSPVLLREGSVGIGEFF